MKKNLFFMIIFFASFLNSCNLKNQLKKVPAQTEYVFGTVCTVNLFDDGTQDLYKKIFLELNHLDDIFSVKKNYSEISKINLSAGKKIINDDGTEEFVKVEISKEVFDVLQFSKKMARATKNNFNPTLGALINLWGIGTDAQKIPSEKEIEDAKNHINPESLNLFVEENKIMRVADFEKIDFFENENFSTENSTDVKKYFACITDSKTQIDLGAIIKGYATDKIVKILKEENVKKAILDFGGNIYVFGKKSETQNWKVGIKNPLAVFENLEINFDDFDESEVPLENFKTQKIDSEKKDEKINKNIPIKIVELEEGSVVTSGNYERFFVQDGKVFHHIIDGKTGRPSESGLASVTVVYKKSLICDALTTAIFVAGKNFHFENFVLDDLKSEPLGIIFVDLKGNITELKY